MNQKKHLRKPTKQDVIKRILSLQQLITENKTSKPLIINRLIQRWENKLKQMQNDKTRKP